ncbi:MAG: SpaA isopeptide-forming pilin-related protein, partial [Chloroflexota bacterium]
MQARLSIRDRRAARITLITLFVIAVLAVFSAIPATASSTVVVTQTNPQGWGFLVETGTGAGSFINGPGTPPLGSGSAQFALDTTASGVILGTADYPGTRLDDLTTLEYSTYNGVGNNTVAPALQFNIDYDLTDSTTDWQGRLVFEPYFDNAIVDGTWQTWDALAGRWWSTGTPVVGDTTQTSNCPSSSPCDVATILTLYPDAGIQTGTLSAILFKAGSGWLAGYTGSVDAFTLGINGTDTTFDFEFDDCAGTANCYVDAVLGDDSNGGTSWSDPLATVQEALDRVAAGGTVHVAPGTYNEIAEDRPQSGTGTGPYDFGLYLGKDGVTLQGYDANDGSPITDYNDPNIPQIVSTAASVFGTQGPFISGNDVTISGLDFTAFNGGNNKNIEVIGNNFTLTHSRVRASDFGSAVYISDFSFSGDATSGTSNVTMYTISNNWLDGGGVVPTNGAGFGGSPVISGNLISGSGNWAISLNGALDGIAWLNYPVGVPTIVGNTFDDNFGNVRFLGTYDSYDAATYWDSILDNNTFLNGWVVALENGGPDLRATEFFNYTTRREIGTVIQDQVNRAESGDTVAVSDGTFNEQVEIDKDDLTLQGQGPDQTFLASDAACTNTMDSAAVAGVRLLGDHSGITLDGFSVSGYDVGLDIGENIGRTIRDVTVSNVNASDNCVHGILSQAGDTEGVVIDNVTANNNGAGFSAGRGLWFINGTKADISITGSTFNDNRLVGIDISDGDVTGLTISGNTVTGNGDSGIGVLGPQGPQPNQVVNNAVTDNGRFGIEIKNPSGTTTVSGNTVSLTGPGSDTRDYAGIAVFRRSPGATNADQPSGVSVTGNSVSGFVEPNGDGEGFGILVEGTGMVVTGNTVSGNDVGIQVQEGNPTPDTNGTNYFDRGDASVAADVTVNNNNITGNGFGMRAVGVSSLVDGTINWWGDTSGPSGEGTGTGDAVSTDVAFCPWLDAAFPGGAPVGASGGIATTSTDGHTTPYCTIEEAMFASSGANQEVHVTEGTWAGEVMNRDYSDSPDLTVIAIGSQANTVVDGITLTGASFDGLTFENFTLTGNAPTPSGFDPDHIVEIAGNGSYAGLAFLGNVFDGQNADDRGAFFSNRGFDGLTLSNNTFTNFENSLARPDGGLIANYSLVFLEAQNTATGSNLVITGNTVEDVRHLNSFEAYRWSNVTISSNSISGVHGRILVWDNGQNSIGSVVISDNTLNLSAGTGDYSTTGISAYYLNGSVEIDGNSVDTAANCVVSIGVNSLSVTNNTFANCDAYGMQFDEPGAGVETDTATIVGNTFDTMPVGVENASDDFPLNVCENTFIDVADRELENPGPFVECVGDLTVEKVVNTNGFSVDQTFNIIVTSDLLADPIVLNFDENGGSQIIEDLEPGSYTVTEMDPGAIWTVTGETTVDIAATEVAAVTITNTFEVDERLNLTSICNEPDGSHLWRVRNPNPYDVPFNWQRVGTGDSGSGIALASTDTFFYSATAGTTKVFFPGGDVTKAANTTACTGSVTIIKTANPTAGWLDFGFSLTQNGNLVEDFSLSGSNSGTDNVASFTLPTGSYTVTETDRPNNWDLTSIVCNSDGVTIDGSSVNFAIERDTDLTCTFTNERRPQISIEKYEDLNLSGSRDPGEPGVSGWPMSIYLNDAQQQRTKDTNGSGNTNFTSLEPGATYRVCEAARDGWTNTNNNTYMWNGLICQDVTVNYGEVVDVSFGNARLGSVTVVKSANPARSQDPVAFGFDGSFGPFTLFGSNDASNTQTFTNVALSTPITISEVSMPDNWVLTDATCDAGDWSVQDGSVNVSLTASGQQVTCTFTNERNAQLRVFKFNDVDGSGAQNGDEGPLSGWEFTVRNASGDVVQRSKSTDASGHATWTNLVPGDYTVCETLQDGWQPTTQADTCQSVSLAYGQFPTLIFGNQETGPTERVSPVLECVIDNYDDTFTARFGYLNANDQSVDIPVGSDNRFTGQQDRGQPTSFAPGRQVAVFSVDFDGSNLVWTLRGPDDRTRTATASANSTRCADQPPPPAGHLQVTKVVDWAQAPVDTDTTFEICVTGPSYPDGDCMSVDYDGGTLTWNDLAPGEYHVSETDPGENWNVTISDSPATVVADQTAHVTVTNTNTFVPPPAERVSPVLECVIDNYDDT